MSATTQQTTEEMPAALSTHSVGDGMLVIKQDLTMSQIGRVLSASGFFKDATSAAQCVVKVMAGQELGIGPIASMRAIHVFDGHITLSVGLMTAMVKRSGRYRYKVLRADDAACEIEFRELVDGEWSLCGPPASFTTDEAGHLERKDNWRYYVRDMLFARAMSRGFRRYCPELSMGTIYVEEDFPDALREAPKAKDKPAETVDDRLSKLGNNGTEEAEPVEPAAAPEPEPKPEPEPVAEADPEPEGDPDPEPEPGPAPEPEPEQEPEKDALTDPERLRAELTATVADLSKPKLIAAIRAEETNQYMDIEEVNRRRSVKVGHIDLAKLTKTELTTYYVSLFV